MGFDISRKPKRMVARALFSEFGIALFECFDNREMFRQRHRRTIGPADRELTVTAHVQKDVVGHIHQNRGLAQRNQRLMELQRMRLSVQRNLESASLGKLESEIAFLHQRLDNVNDQLTD